MGHSIALSGRLSFPASRAAALRSLVIDCETFDDWPSSNDLFEAGPSEPRSIEAIVSAFQNGSLAEVEWADDSLRIAGIVGADDAAWIYGGRELLALFRAAGRVGASGGLGMTGWLDGGPGEVVSITTKADGSNNVAVMRGAQAENAAQAIHEKVEHLAEAITKPAALAAPTDPAVLPLAGPELEHHKTVVLALAKHDSRQLFELARALDTPDDTERFLLGTNPFQLDPLTTVLRDADSLMTAFRSGLPKLKDADARRLAKRALELYARLDREGARTLAQRAIEANLQGPVRAQAELLAVKSTDANAGLAALRRVLASNPPSHPYDLMDHPLIEKISKQPAARTVVLRELASIAGGAFEGKPQWKPLTRDQIFYVAALSFVLEAVIDPDDDARDALLALWTTHPSGDLAFLDLALERGAAARKIFIERFGDTDLELERAVPFHAKAAELALQHDAASALGTMRALMKAKPLHTRTEDIAHGLVVALDEADELPKDAGFREVLLAINRAYKPQHWAADASSLAKRFGSAASAKPAPETPEPATDAAPKPPRTSKVAAPEPQSPPKAAAEKPAAEKKAAPKKATPEKPAPKPAASKQPAEKPVASKKAAPKKAAPKKAAPKKVAPKKAAPKKAAPKKAAPKKAAAKKAAPKKTAPQNATKKAAPKKAPAKKRK